MFEELIKIADSLNSAGFYKEANEIDLELEKAKQQVAEQALGAAIPMGGGNKQEIAVDSLKNTFSKYLLNSPFKDYASEIVGILDKAVNKFTSLEGDRRQKKLENAIFVSPQGVALASNIANLESDILDIKNDLNQTSKEEEVLSLKRELESDQKKLQTQYKLLQEHLAQYPKESEEIYKYIDAKKKNRQSPLSLNVERRMGD